MPANSLPVPSPSLRVYQCNKGDMRNSREQNFKILFAPLPFNWPNFLSVEIVDVVFPKRWNWQICHGSHYFHVVSCPRHMTHHGGGVRARAHLCLTEGKLTTKQKRRSANRLKLWLGSYASFQQNLMQLSCSQPAMTVKMRNM